MSVHELISNASGFESRQQLRAEEIEATTKAMEIISSSAVSGNADKFVDERTALEKEEMNGKHAYDMLVQDLTAQIDQATQDREEKSEIKADAQGDLTDTTTTMEADEKYLSDLTATCEQKASDLEGTQKELDAALSYFDKLKPSCLDAGVSFDDSVACKKEEVESLQEALRILNGEDLA